MVNAQDIFGLAARRPSGCAGHDAQDWWYDWVPGFILPFVGYVECSYPGGRV